MKHIKVKSKFLTLPSFILVLLMLAGLAAAVYRFVYGLGAATNLTDDWAWGLWKGFNVLVLIAFGAGGFTSAALVYVFGGEKYHGLARSTALFALLCYSFAGASLMVDIGIPWRIINPIYMWPAAHSLLFEVAWCVMLYLSVLALEVAPAALEWLGLKNMQGLWRKLVPVYSVIGLGFFTYLMSHSIAWTASALIFFAVVAFLTERVKDRPSTPLLLIMFGVILSANHQSSLGSLFLLMPDKLSHFWWSPTLPFNFFFSAMLGGFAMLIVERTITSKVFGREIPTKMLTNLSKVVAGFLWFYLTFRLSTVLVELTAVAGEGNVAQAFGGRAMGLLFLVEIFVGLFVPAILLSTNTGRQTNWIRFTAVSLIVLGVMFNRLNVTFMGMNMPGTYIPSMIEFAVSIATLAAIIFLYGLGTKLLPLNPEEGADDAAQETKQVVTA
jgi:formate dehydrogenase iron-sulfur subunit